MEKAFVRKAELKDALELAPRIRKGDLEEIKASSNTSALKALVAPFSQATSKTFSIVETESEKVIGMFGVAECAEPDYGVAWMLSSEDLFKHNKIFIKECPKWIYEMGKGYKYLYNFVDKRNWKSLKWLQYLGFEPTTEMKEYGYGKMPFLLMMKEMNK
jgi:hypothetical protein